MSVGEEWWGAREIENPKVSGWSLKRRVRIVDFPEPEGPDITIGRWVCIAGWSVLRISSPSTRMDGVVPEGAIVEYK